MIKEIKVLKKENYFINNYKNINFDLENLAFINKNDITSKTIYRSYLSIIDNYIFNNINVIRLFRSI